MKKSGLYLLLIIISLGTLNACGPSEEERKAAEQARLDSLRQVELANLAELEKARNDSMAKAEEERLRAEEEANRINFADGGEYAVQVGAWRSKEKAENYTNIWSDRDYARLYVVQYGDSSKGDTWYRVRVGFFDTKEDAEKLGIRLSEEINSGYWVSKVERSSN